MNDSMPNCGRMTLLLILLLIFLIVFKFECIQIPQPSTIPPSPPSYSYDTLQVLITDACINGTETESLIKNIKDNIEHLWSINEHYFVFDLLNETFCGNNCNQFPDSIKQSLLTSLNQEFDQMMNQTESDHDWDYIRNVYKCINGECGKEDKQCCVDECDCINGYEAVCNTFNNTCMAHPEKDENGYDVLIPHCQKKVTHTYTDQCQECVKLLFPNHYNCIQYKNDCKGKSIDTAQGTCWGVNSWGANIQCRVTYNSCDCEGSDTATPAPRVCQVSNAHNGDAIIHRFCPLVTRNDLPKNRDTECIITKRANYFFRTINGYTGKWKLHRKENDYYIYNNKNRQGSIAGQHWQTRYRIEDCIIEQSAPHGDQSWKIGNIDTVEVKWCKLKWKNQRRVQVAGVFAVPVWEDYWAAIHVGRDEYFAIICPN